MNINLAFSFLIVLSLAAPSATYATVILGEIDATVKSSTYTFGTGTQVGVFNGQKLRLSFSYDTDLLPLDSDSKTDATVYSSRGGERSWLSLNGAYWVNWDGSLQENLLHIWSLPNIQMNESEDSARVHQEFSKTPFPPDSGLDYLDLWRYHRLASASGESWFRYGIDFQALVTASVLQNFPVLDFDTTEHAGGTFFINAYANGRNVRTLNAGYRIDRLTLAPESAVSLPTTALLFLFGLAVFRLSWRQDTFSLHYL